MNPTASLDISDLVSQISRGAVINEAQLDPVLDRLRDFECWSLYFKILEAQIDNPKRRQVHHYVRTASAYAINLEDIQKSAEVCVKLMKDVKLSYAEFREKALRLILGEQDYEREAIVLQAVLPKFRAKE